MNRHVRNLFLLRVAGEGQPGAGDEPPAPPAGSGGDGDGGDGGEPGAQPPKVISPAEHKKVQREAQNLRTRLREAEAAKAKALEEATKLKTHFKVESVDDLPDVPDDEPPPPAAPARPAPGGRSAESIRLEKQVADLTKQQAKLLEERAREHQEKVTLKRDSVINEQIRQMGLVDPQEIETAFAKLEKHTLTHENEDGSITFTQKFTDPKTKEELEETPTFQTASLILPKSLQPARGGPGSGGGTPRLSSDPKDNDLLTKAVGSQAEYEKNREKVLTAERSQLARTGGSVTTDSGARG